MVDEKLSTLRVGKGNLELTRSHFLIKPEKQDKILDSPSILISFSNN